MVTACALGGALLGASACVDLFHSTDFVTLCSIDAAACHPETTDAKNPSEGDGAGGAAIDLCTKNPTPEKARESASRACAWLGSCLGSIEQSPFASCMLRAEAAYSCSLNPSLRPQGKAAALWACLADIDSCAGVRQCVYGATPPACNPAETGTFTACADDETVVECGSSVSTVASQSCALEGRTCARVDDGKAICAGKEGTTCTGSARCSETFAILCKTGSIHTDVGVDCAAFGSGQCARDDAGAACRPSDDAASCTGSSKITCDDAGTAHSCVDGKSVIIRCGELRSGCSELAPPLNPLGACVTEDAGPPCGTGADTCDQNVLRSCAQGNLFEVDCQKVGLDGCGKPTTGASSSSATCLKL